MSRRGSGAESIASFRERANSVACIRRRLLRESMRGEEAGGVRGAGVGGSSLAAGEAPGACASSASASTQAGGCSNTAPSAVRNQKQASLISVTSATLTAVSSVGGELPTSNKRALDSDVDDDRHRSVPCVRSVPLVSRQSEPPMPGVVRLVRRVLVGGCAQEADDSDAPSTRAGRAAQSVQLGTRDPLGRSHSTRRSHRRRHSSCKVRTSALSVCF